MNEKLIRLSIFIFVAALHIVVILFVAFDTQRIEMEAYESANIMRLIDLEELPPPPPPSEPELPQVEEIAEVMIETDYVPQQIVVPAGSIVTPTPVSEEFLPAHRVSSTPQFDEEAIARDIVYPPIALRSGIEGRVILDLFVDRNGIVQRINILREEPEGRGFGEAAVRVFAGRQGLPATANGEPVSCRFRYPVVFRIR
jgi:protein TonB